MKLLLIGSIFMFSCLLCKGQTRIIGRVVEEVSEVAVPFAGVGLPKINVASVADENGFFTITIDSLNTGDTLNVYSVGYVKSSTVLSGYNLSDTLLISLKRETYILPTAQVSSRQAALLMAEVIKKLKYNFKDSNLLQNAFYIQYHRENGKYVRLILADLCIASDINFENNYLTAYEEVAVKSILRTNVFEKNKEEHSDHLMELISENPVYHSVGSPLNQKALFVYRFEIDTSNNDQSTIKVFFFNSTQNEAKIEKGFLIIDANTKAVLRFYREELPSANAFRSAYKNNSGNYTWHFVKSVTDMTYSKQGQLYYPETFLKSYTHQLVSNKTHSDQFTVEENFELHFEPYDKKIITEGLHFSFASNLYTSRFRYNQSLDFKYRQTPLQFADKEAIGRDLNQWDAIW